MADPPSLEKLAHGARAPARSRCCGPSGRVRHAAAHLAHRRPGAPGPQAAGRGHAPAEAAVAVGFTDQPHLNRHFTRIVGVPPGAYRGSAGLRRGASGERGRGRKNVQDRRRAPAPSVRGVAEQTEIRTTERASAPPPAPPAKPDAAVVTGRARRRRRRRALRLRLRRDLGRRRAQPAADLCAQPAGVHRGLAVRPGRRARRGRQPAHRRGRRVLPGRAQRLLRAAAVRSSSRCRARGHALRRPLGHRRDHRRRPGPARPAQRPARLHRHRADPLRRCGTSPRCSARWAPRRSATPTPGGWTRPARGLPGAARADAARTTVERAVGRRSPWCWSWAAARCCPPVCRCWSPRSPRPPSSSCRGSGAAAGASAGRRHRRPHAPGRSAERRHREEEDR